MISRIPILRIHRRYDLYQLQLFQERRMGGAPLLLILRAQTYLNLFLLASSARLKILSCPPTRKQTSRQALCCNMLLASLLQDGWQFLKRPFRRGMSHTT